jgi:hypothetical protein
METMRANVFHGVNDIRIEEVERPRASFGENVPLRSVQSAE